MLPPDTYGEFLLWGEGGQCRYLLALTDAVYAEVGDIVDEITGGGESGWESADNLQRVFGVVACDKAADGESFGIRRLPRCPGCQGSPLSLDRYTNPAVIVDVDVPSPSYHGWKQLSSEDKRKRVGEALRAAAVGKAVS